jgi:hypothetical protein
MCKSLEFPRIPILQTFRIMPMTQRSHPNHLLHHHHPPYSLRVMALLYLAVQRQLIPPFEHPHLTTLSFQMHLDLVGTGSPLWQVPHAKYSHRAIRNHGANAYIYAFDILFVVVRQWKANDLYDNADKISIIVQHILGTNRVAGAHYLDKVTEVVVTEQQLGAHCIDTCIGKNSPVGKPTTRNPSKSLSHSLFHTLPIHHPCAIRLPCLSKSELS